MGKLKNILFDIEDLYRAGFSPIAIAAMTHTSIDLVQDVIDDLHSFHDQETYAAHSFEEEEYGR